MRKAGKRRNTVISMIVIMLLQFCLFERVSALNTDQDNHKNMFEGYIVSVSSSTQIEQSDIINQVETDHSKLILVEDLHSVIPLLQEGAVDHIEPNYEVTLFNATENKDNQEPDDWVYQAVSGDFGANNGLYGEGVKIALIDSGLDRNNPDLQNAVINEGYDYITESDSVSDSAYHGTKVAQIIAGDDNTLGNTGISPKASIVPLDCFSSSNVATVLVLAKAIRDAVDIYDCDIINMSWGLTIDSEVLHDAIRYAYEKGAILVSAAGNVNGMYEQGTSMYPACYSEVISVSAVDSSMEALDISQQNDHVVVCAPGGDISFVRSDGNLVIDKGTSFSTPCVSALLAQIKQLAPWITNDDVFELLKTRCVDLGENGRDPSYGYGFAKADELIKKQWCIVSNDHANQDESFDVKTWLVDEAGSRIIAAAYTSGKMNCAQMEVLNDKYGSKVYSFNKKDMDNVGVFFLDEKYVPVSDCVKYFIDDEIIQSDESVYNSSISSEPGIGYAGLEFVNAPENYECRCFNSDEYAISAENIENGQYLVLVTRSEELPEEDKEIIFINQYEVKENKLVARISSKIQDVLMNMHIISSKNNQLITIRSNEYEPGDVNRDGEINAYDLTLLARFVARIDRDISSITITAADINQDGSVDSRDITVLARKLARIG